jgi:hypothetical protein
MSALRVISSLHRSKKLTRRKRGEHSTKAKCENPAWYRPEHYKKLSGQLGHAYNRLVKNEQNGRKKTSTKSPGERPVNSKTVVTSVTSPVEKAPDPVGKDAGWQAPSGAQMCTSTLRQAAGCGKSIQTLHGVVHLPAA